MNRSAFSSRVCRDLYRNRLEQDLKGFKPFLAYDERMEFYVRLVAESNQLKQGGVLVDLGCGLSLFGLLCRVSGLEVSMVDDFGGGGGVKKGSSLSDLPLLAWMQKSHGMRIFSQNFLETALPFAAASVDVVTCFHSLEHWHHSPRRLFAEICRILKPGGTLLLATPNAANFRKRLFLLAGKTNFPDLGEWYHEGDPVFRGHVREPVLRDLQNLLRWNHLEITGTWGRNFIGADSLALSFLPKPVVRFVARTSATILHHFPTLCSDLHIAGRKPA